MTVDTISLNQQRDHLPDQGESIWLFGYGSLIYKVDFNYIERRPAEIQGWVRRFWQGSHDHRGTPEKPGRVATLIRQPGARCPGMAYRVGPEVFDHLDVREKNGYLRFTTPLRFQNGGAAEGLVYIATEDNAAFLGPAEERHIASHIGHCAGPSGPNRDYLLDLAESLRELGDPDGHVFRIEAHLRELENPKHTTDNEHQPADCSPDSGSDNNNSVRRTLRV